MEKQTFGLTRRLAAWLAAVAIAGALAIGFSTPALAAGAANSDLPDVMLAVFTNSDNDGTDTFYMSADGYNFEKISEAFVDLTPNDASSNRAYGSGTVSNPFYYGSHYRTWDLYAFSCPSIIYHNGYFWMLSNEWNSGNDGTVRLVISNSKDLVHWCDQKPVKVSMPGGFQDNGTPGQFDVVAADWAVGADGNVYVVFSAGYYGNFHGDAENDIMWPYMIKISELSATNDPADNPMNNNDSAIRVRAERAKPIQLPGYGFSSNRIDGSLYFEGGQAYMSIKKNGVTNEIWRIGNINDCSNDAAWSLVNDNVVTGYEAPSLTKFNGTYYMITDELGTWTPDDHVRQPYYRTGVHSQHSSNLASGWSSPARINAYDSRGTSLTIDQMNNMSGDGPRHGTVITVTDPKAKEIIWAQREKAGWNSTLPGLPNASGFTDVPDDAWFYDTVRTAVALGYMRGYEGMQLFGPDDNITRGQVAIVLYNMANGKVGASGTTAQKIQWSSKFSDVGPSDYFAEAVGWAVESGVVGGYPDGTFHPNNDISREEFAQMLMNYAKACGNNTAVADPSAVLSRYPDGTSVSEWARPAVSWAADEGIMGAGGSLAPIDPIKRSEAATMAVRYQPQSL